jgi:hypothetical protein
MDALLTSHSKAGFLREGVEKRNQQCAGRNCGPVGLTPDDDTSTRVPVVAGANEYIGGVCEGVGRVVQLLTARTEVSSKNLVIIFIIKSNYIDNNSLLWIVWRPGYVLSPSDMMRGYSGTLF